MAQHLTKRGSHSENTPNWKEHLSVRGLEDCGVKYTGAGLDPRIVELVRFMARRAAENDYEAMLEAAKDKEKLFPEGGI